jgi:hypothetical protein
LSTAISRRTDFDGLSRFIAFRSSRIEMGVKDKTSINPLKVEFLQKKRNSSVRASQETLYVSATKISRLMLFRDKIAVYCENYRKHADTLCGLNAVLLC